MTTDNKTLADVQPGGRVRLGDQAELDRLEFQAWARELLPCPFCGSSAEFVPYKDNGLTLKCKSMGCIQRNQRTLRYGIDWLRTSMTEHWNARALSAQPSPGGQGGLNYERMFVDACAALAEVSRELGCDPEQGGAEPILAAIAELREAIAARQPVGEPVGRVRTRVDGGFIAELLPGVADRLSNMAPLYLHQPAQAVDLGAVREAIRKAWQKCAAGESVDLQFGTLLALIDSQAVGNG